MDLHVYRNSQDRWRDLKRSAAERGAVLGLNAVTLEELVRRLTPDLQTISSAQKLVLLRRAVADSDPASFAGVLRHAFDAIAELKAAGVATTADDDGSPPVLKILSAYQKHLRAANLIDAEDRCWRAAARAKEQQGWIAQFERIVLHAIYDLNEAEFALLRNAIQSAPEGGTVILFNTTANVKATQFAEWTWRRFVQNENLAERTFPEFCRASSPNSPLIERLFVFEDSTAAGEPPVKLDRLSSLEILQAPGRYREMEIIGARISDLLKAGEDASEIAVAVRHIETYGEMIEDVFSRYRIPHYFDTGVPLLRAPFIKYWFAFIDLVSGDRSRHALARVLSSAYFQEKLAPTAERTDMEAELASLGYLDRWYLPAADLARRKNSALTPELHRLENRLNELEGMRAAIPAFMKALAPPAALPQRDSESWRILAEELESAADLAGEMTFSEFRNLASTVASLRTADRSLKGCREIASEPGRPQIRITSPASLGSCSYMWIFSPGHADGEIPAYAPSNPLLSDAAVDEINRLLGSRRLRTSRERHRSEPLLLFLLLDSAEKRITLTYPGKTLEGDPIYPSSYLMEIARHFDVPPIERFEGSSGVREIGECRRRIAEEWRAGSIAERSALDLLGKDIVRRARHEASGPRRADMPPGVLPLNGVWSPSELNSLASCPFIFLARHRLRLRPEELPDFEVPAMETGRLAHDVLRSFYASPLPASLEETRARVDALIERHLSAMDVSGQGSSFAFDPFLWRIRRRQLVSALHTYAAFALKDAADGYETLPEFLDAPLPAASLGSIRLGGRPDHVAVRRAGNRVEGIRIDDFKYSAASSATNKALKDSFQIPVYAYLAARMLDAGQGASIEGRYLLLKSPSTPVVSQSIDGAVFAELSERIESLVEKVRSGRLHPDPSAPGDCSLCEYRRLCRQYGG